MAPVINYIAIMISTVFFIGYIPFAPGTFGSLAAVAFVRLIRPAPPLQACIIVAGFVIGTLASHYAEKSLGKDSRHIVADEFVGYLISIVFLPLTTGYMIAAFILFRFFDIIKPPPIRNVERRVGGGLGIMLDDVLAGIFTNLILHAWRII